MTVVVSFVRPAGLGSIHAPGVGTVRVRENITVPGTTTASLLDGEEVYVMNDEPTAVAVALGTTPDAAALAATAATQAGLGIPSGAAMTFVGSVGDRVNIKAVT